MTKAALQLSCQIRGEDALRDEVGDAGCSRRPLVYGEQPDAGKPVHEALVWISQVCEHSGIGDIAGRLGVDDVALGCGRQNNGMPYVPLEDAQQDVADNWNKPWIETIPNFLELTQVLDDDQARLLSLAPNTCWSNKPPP